MERERHRGYVVSFARGYGFITTGASADDTNAPRYFFHATSVDGNSDSIVAGKMVTFTLAHGKGDRLCAVHVRDAAGQEVSFKRTAAINMNVSRAGRRVGVVASQTGKFCFVTDQENGERVFIPIPLARGQQVEYTLEMTEKGPAGADVTGPMGSRLERPSAVAGGGGGGGKTKAPAREDKPKARPQAPTVVAAKQQLQLKKAIEQAKYDEDGDYYYDDEDDDYYDAIDDKYM